MELVFQRDVFAFTIVRYMYIIKTPARLQLASICIYLSLSRGRKKKKKDTSTVVNNGGEHS